MLWVLDLFRRTFWKRIIHDCFTLEMQRRCWDFFQLWVASAAFLSGYSPNKPPQGDKAPRTLPVRQNPGQKESASHWLLFAKLNICDPTIILNILIISRLLPSGLCRSWNNKRGWEGVTYFWLGFYMRMCSWPLPICGLKIKKVWNSRGRECPQSISYKWKCCCISGLLLLKEKCGRENRKSKVKMLM